jgi:hypothetical protein
MSARLDIGEVSLTVTIGKIFGQFVRTVVARDFPAR